MRSSILAVSSPDVPGEKRSILEFYHWKDLENIEPKHKQHRHETKLTTKEKDTSPLNVEG